MRLANGRYNVGVDPFSKFGPDGSDGLFSSRASNDECGTDQYDILCDVLPL